MVFFGSSAYSLPILKALLELGQRPLVISGPDRRQGRGQKPMANPLAQFAQKQKLTVLKPAKLEPALASQLGQQTLALCAVYGQIIPDWLLHFFSEGILNFHPSLLPAYRGATPAVGMILDHQRRGGFSVIKMDAKLDHGPILYQQAWPLPANWTASWYYQKAFGEMARQLKNILFAYRHGQLQPKTQNQQGASFTYRLSRQDGYLPPKFFAAARQNLPNSPIIPPIFRHFRRQPHFRPAVVAFDLWRALTPWPGLWTEVKIAGRQQRLKILHAQLTPQGTFLPNQVQLASHSPTNWSNLAQLIDKN